MHSAFGSVPFLDIMALNTPPAHPSRAPSLDPTTTKSQLPFELVGSDGKDDIVEVVSREFRQQPLIFVVVILGFSWVFQGRSDALCVALYGVALCSRLVPRKLTS